MTVCSQDDRGREWMLQIGSAQPKWLPSDGVLLQPGSDIIRIVMNLCIRFSVLLVVEGSRMIARLVTWTLDFFE
jgi:hypothetical protein